MDDLQIAELVIGSVIIAAVTILFFEGVGRLIRGIALRAGARKSTGRTILEVARVLGICFAAFGIVAYTGLASVLAVLTISGIIGLVVSLSLQATFSNVVAGILLLRDRAISHGDIITYGSVKGRVIRVAMRNTWVLTESGDVAVIGNSALNSGPLINHSASPEFVQQYQEV